MTRHRGLGFKAAMARWSELEGPACCTRSPSQWDGSWALRDGAAVRPSYRTLNARRFARSHMVDFAGNHPRVHRCFSFPNRGTVAERNAFVSALRAEKYDMAYFTNPDLLWVVVRAKISLRIHEHSDFLFKLLCKGTPMS